MYSRIFLEELVRALKRTPIPSFSDGASGYFSKPQKTLDPALFLDSTHGPVIRNEVRHHVLSTLFRFWKKSGFKEPERWATVWFAGSGISYQWAGDRGNGDLDTIVGFDWPLFYQCNPQWNYTSIEHTTDYIDNELRTKLWPRTAQTHISMDGRIWETSGPLNESAPAVGLSKSSRTENVSSVSGSTTGSFISGESTESHSKTTTDFWTSSLAAAPSVARVDQGDGTTSSKSTTATRRGGSEDSSASTATTVSGALGTQRSASQESLSTSTVRTYEVTYFVNQDASDIRNINPYAAYNLSTDTWTVRPPEHTAYEDDPGTPTWKIYASHDVADTEVYTATIRQVLQMLENPGFSDGQRVNLLNQLNSAAVSAAALMTNIHSSRREAFRRGGHGYFDFNNWRWQMAKKNGVVAVLGAVERAYREAEAAAETSQYGAPLAGADQLILRAAFSQENRP